MRKANSQVLDLSNWIVGWGSAPWLGKDGKWNGFGVMKRFLVVFFVRHFTLRVTECGRKFVCVRVCKWAKYLSYEWTFGLIKEQKAWSRIGPGGHLKLWWGPLVAWKAVSWKGRKEFKEGRHETKPGTVAPAAALGGWGRSTFWGKASSHGCLDGSRPDWVK